MFLAGLIFVMAIDAYILSFPLPEENPVVVNTTSQQRTIAVLSFEDLELAEDGNSFRCD